ncbi:hypothetical protein [Micromonospora thermarum]|uniref:Uncharacterized protein n=1 Tax=Micromonospora thermarum TaxID=2720024 RepID=A0ABX0ZE82_9ACTN|nr:hypothetical protein [Micromonospora thermarum]NJP34834.1 hypothetical protein [Micromonospora thermarum]
MSETLLSVAHTMVATRRSVLGLINDHDIESPFVVFAEPDEEAASGAEPVHLNLEQEVIAAEAAWGRVKQLLEPVMQEVGTWR